MMPVMLMILDGWGYREGGDGNAIAEAKAPNWQKLWGNNPHTTLNPSGIAVGLPEGTMGNSEVGHLNLGAGRVVHQELTRINESVSNGSFFKNNALSKLFAGLKSAGGALHLMGLASDAGVHSHLNHLYALVELALNNKIDKIFVHLFTDGRDSPPDSGINYIKEISRKLSGKAEIATVTGRYYAMDRDKRWDRVADAYKAIVNGKGENADTAEEAVKHAYAKGKTDEFIAPTVIGIPKPLKNNDTAIFFNFRADRARELTHAITDADFNKFNRRPLKLYAFATMTRYDEKFSLPVIFPPLKLKNILGEVVAKKGFSQLRIAETEKYAHVTYFFNGGEEKVFEGEERVLIPSPRDVATYDKKPEMSAYEVTDQVIKRIKSNKYGLIVLNFANPDMVGHTGNLKAAIKAVETVDECVGKVVDAMLKAKGIVMITGDHGNCEEMFDDRHHPHTAHTTRLVPYVLIGEGLEKAKLKNGCALCDCAPTILDLMSIPKPKEMTGTSLIVR
jgi:2,3-bisphosphoglycerate-independent phosphoglycerate mutase